MSQRKSRVVVVRSRISASLCCASGWPTTTSCSDDRIAMRERRVERPAGEQLARAVAERGQVGRRVEDVEDDGAHLAHVVLGEAAHGRGGRADAYPGGDR